MRGLGTHKIILSSRSAPIQFEAASIDGILDTVGAPLFENYMGGLMPGQRVLRSQGAEPAGDPDGVLARNLDGTALRRAVAALAEWIEERSVAAPRFVTVPLSEAARAHAMLESGGVSGRVLLVP